MEREINVGAFRGLITTEGKVLLQMRIEEGSMFGPSVSYKGDFELPGGAVKEKDLRKVLTPKVLAQESARETEEELGIVVSGPSEFPIYRAVYIYPERDKEDWAFMIPTSPAYWDEKAKMKRKTVEVTPDQLDVLGELNLVVSGKKRMWRMAMGALFVSSSEPRMDSRAAKLLKKVKPDWFTTEFCWYPEEALSALQRDLGLK